MTFREAVAALAGRQKTAKGAPPYSRFVNRPIGRVLAAAAYVVGLKPNTVTILSGIATTAGLVLLATTEPSAAMAIALVALLVLGYALDSADGQVARLLGEGSPEGEWLDHTLDSAKIVAIHLCVLISLYRFGDLTDDRLLLIPLAFATSSTVLFFSWLLRDMLLRGTSAATNSVQNGDRHSPLASLVKLFEDYGVLMLCLLALPNTDAFLVLYSVLAGWSVVSLAIFIPVRFKTIQRLGATV